MGDALELLEESEMGGQRAKIKIGSCACEALEERRLLSGTFYYVSPTGSDANSGTSASSPWQTIAKVNDTVFQGGDHILFQRGGQWEEALEINGEDGDAGDPIVFGAYGDPSEPKPLLLGSNPLDDSQFTLYSGTTYLYASSTPLYWIYNDHTFTRDAEDATNSTNATTELNFVESTAGSFYFNTTTNQLYLNLGVPITNQVLTATLRDPEVNITYSNYITIEDLACTETAHYSLSYAFGYGMSVFKGLDVSMINCDADLAGKHSFIAVDCANFVGENLLAVGTAADLGYGGASAFVTYDDQNTYSNASASWINDTYVETVDGTGGGGYLIFISHGTPNTTNNILLQNLQCPSGCVGISISSVGPAETVEVIGGYLGGGGWIDMGTSNSYIDGLTVSGASSGIKVDGTNDVVQNCVVSQASPNPGAGEDGGIVDNGYDNTIRFNTISLVQAWNSWPGIGVINSNAQTAIYGNIVDCSIVLWMDYDNPNGSLSYDDDNVFSTTPIFGEGGNPVSLAQWQTTGYDLHSVVADPKFVDPTNGDYELQAGSPAIDLYQGTPNNSLVSADTDFNGNPRPVGDGYDAGAFEYGPVAAAPLVLTATDDAMPIQLKLIAAASADEGPLLGVWIDSDTAGGENPTMTVPLDQVSGVTVNAAGMLAQDLVVDFSGGSFALANGITYSANGNGELVMIGSGGSDTIAVTSGEVLLDGLSIAGTMASTLEINSGSATLVYEPGSARAAATPVLSVEDDGGFIVAAGSAGAGINAVNLGGLSIGAAATAAIGMPVDAADRTVLELGSLAIAAGGSLDMGSNDMVLHNGSAAQVEGWLASGFDFGAWDGSGLTSSAAGGDPDHLHAVGYESNDAGGSVAMLNSFDGQVVSASDVLVKYTVYGDANLDGVVNGTDYLLTDNGFALHLTDWRDGDFNYDGVVNGDDYSLLDNAFESEGAGSGTPAQSASATNTVKAAGLSSNVTVAMLSWWGAVPTFVPVDLGDLWDQLGF